MSGLRTGPVDELLFPIREALAKVFLISIVTMLAIDIVDGPNIARAIMGSAMMVSMCLFMGTFINEGKTRNGYPVRVGGLQVFWLILEVVSFTGRAQGWPATSINPTLSDLYLVNFICHGAVLAVHVLLFLPKIRSFFV